MKIKALLAALLLVGTSAVAFSTAEARSGAVLFSKECANARFEPSEILIACADARVIFNAQDWTRWDSTGARATGTLVYADCPSNVPLVACHHNATDPASVYLYRVRFCPSKGRRYFTRLLMRDPDATNKYLKRVKLSYPCGHVQ